MVAEIVLRRSPLPGKKFRVEHGRRHHVDFGQRGASDYTRHGDRERMLRYLRRHGGVVGDDDDAVVSTRETWTKEGIGTAGFWARWLLWSRPNLSDAIALIRDRFGVRFLLKRATCTLRGKKVAGTVTVRSISASVTAFACDLTGLPPGEQLTLNVHEEACGAARTRLGTVVADRHGVCKSEGHVDDTVGEMVGRSLILHAKKGARLACGRIEWVAA